MKKIFILVCVFGLLMQFGCAKPGATKKSGKTLNVWLDATPKELSFFAEVANSFKAIHPEATVKFNVMKFEDLKPAFFSTNEIASGPDVVMLVNDWLGELTDKQMIATCPLNTDELIPLTVKSLMCNGQLMAYPWSFETVGLIYNRHLISQPPQTFENLLEISEELRKRDYYPLMYDNKNFYYHAPWFFAFGGSIFENSKIALNTASAANSLKFARELEGKYKIIPEKSNQPASINLFCSGKVGMMINGPWILQELERNNVNFSVCPIPAVGKHLPQPFVGVKGFAVSSQSDKQDLAWKFVSHITGELNLQSAMERLKILPCLKKIYDGTYISGALKGFARQAELGIPLPSNPKMKYVWNEANWMLRQTFNTDRTPEDILTEVEAKINKKIAEESN